MLSGMPDSPLPDHPSILGEVREIRRVGLLRLRQLEIPSLVQAAAALGTSPERSDGRVGVDQVEWLLRAAVEGVDTGTLREAAEYSLGLAQGTRDWAAADRRRRAAELYGVSVERFRKHHEVMVLGEVADQIERIAQRSVSSTVRDSPVAAGTRQPFASTHRTLRVAVAGAASFARVELHVHPVDLLRDVDVVVSPSNVFFALPEPFKSSVSASLRRSGGLRDASGGLVEDSVHEELRGWAARHGLSGRAAWPGTVAATGSGALAAQRIRRIYHAAVAVPRAGTNDYDVLPADVTRAAARVLAVLAAESDHFEPPLRSVCFPLLGSGRGGLSYEQSLGSIWEAVEAELARSPHWEVHLVVRHQATADLVERLLAGSRGPGRDDEDGHP
jgi:hypothetical protein